MSETRSIREVPHPRALYDQPEPIRALAARSAPAARSVPAVRSVPAILPERVIPARVMPARVMPDPRASRARPDANPLRLMMGLVGIASASALTSAMLPSVLPRGVEAVVADVAATSDATPFASADAMALASTDPTAAAALTPSPKASTIHVTAVSKSKAAQTAAPAVVAQTQVTATAAPVVATAQPTQRVVAVQPASTPKPHVVTTRASGAP